MRRRALPLSLDGSRVEAGSPGAEKPAGIIGKPDSGAMIPLVFSALFGALRLLICFGKSVSPGNRPALSLTYARLSVSPMVGRFPYGHNWEITLPHL